MKPVCQLQPNHLRSTQSLGRAICHNNGTYLQCCLYYVRSTDGVATRQSLSSRLECLNRNTQTEDDRPVVMIRARPTIGGFCICRANLSQVLHTRLASLVHGSSRHLDNSSLLPPTTEPLSRAVHVSHVS
jgi:hypothetical protein